MSKYQWFCHKNTSTPWKFLKLGSAVKVLLCRPVQIAVLSSIIFLFITESYFSKLKKKEPGMFS